jgi:hypothetical protein
MSAKTILEKHTPERLDSSLKNVDVRNSVCPFALLSLCDVYDQWEPCEICLRGGIGCEFADKLELSKKKGGS